MLSSLVASFQPLVQTSFQVTAIFPFMAMAPMGMVPTEMVPTGMGLITGMVPMGMAPMGMGLITGMAPMGMVPMGMVPMGMVPMGMGLITGMALMGMAPMGMAPMGMAPMGMAPMGMAPTGMGLITRMVRMGMVPTAMDGITAIAAITAGAGGSTRDCSKYRLDCRSVALSARSMCPQAYSQGFKDSKVISTLPRERAGRVAADLEVGLMDDDIAVKDEPRTPDAEIGQARIEEEFSICQLRYSALTAAIYDCHSQRAADE